MPAAQAENNQQITGSKPRVAEGAEESALTNFFRQVDTKHIPVAKIDQNGIVIPMRRKVQRQIGPLASTATNPMKPFWSLRRATRELLGRLGFDSMCKESVTASVAPNAATIYKYRSKANITYTDLPAIAVNQ
jgi:hypothetical protein